MSRNLQTLDDWLEWQLRLHPREVELGLDRVREVWRRLGSPAPAATVITVGGTNGKGSSVAFLEAILRAAGLRVGAFTSPHLLRYNERVRIDGADADDQSLIAAFARIEDARGDVALTYFEFGTLAALLIFAHSALDVAVLEVGLGGRLDAVNIIDADAAIVTTVDLDHQDWLGSDRETIAREKAGIFRAGRPAVIGDATAPAALSEEARRQGALLWMAGEDFHVEVDADQWIWSAAGVRLTLPHPALDAPCQRSNAAAAIAVLHALRHRLSWRPQAIAEGIANARAAARLQRFGGPVELLVDVAHNPQAARVLAEWLDANPPAGRNIAVFGALADKDVTGIVAALRGPIDRWLLAGLDAQSPRGLDSSSLQGRMLDASITAFSGMHPGVEEALRAARTMARPGDRIVAFGSFFVAAAALAYAPVFATNAA